MPAAKSFNNIIIGQFALTGIPTKVYVQGRFLTITDPDDVENPLIGFGMDENGRMIQFDYTQVEKLSVAGNDVDIKTYNKGMEKKFGAEEEGGDKDKEKDSGAAEKSALPGGDEKKEESYNLEEDLPTKLKDLVSTIDINDDHLSKVFADNHGLEDGSGAPSPAAGVELQTLDTADDEEIAGYEAVGGQDETEIDHELTVKAGLPQTQDVHHEESLDDDPLEEISIDEMTKRFRKLYEISKDEADAKQLAVDAEIAAGEAKIKSAKDKEAELKKQPIEDGVMNEYTFGTGDIVKDINPKCPHYGSKGIIQKMMDIPGKGVVAIYTVTNNGKTFKSGDKLSKTVDQLEKV